MIERRSFVKRQTPVVLEVGAHTGWFLRHMLEKRHLFGLKQYIQTDISEERLNRNYEEIKHLIPKGVEFVQVCCDEESDDSPFELPERSVDMAVSNLSMHWVNNLEQAMVNIRHVLKPDAFLLLSIFGGNTLHELRSSFSLAEKESEGGLSPHISPMVDGAAISSLMLQSGYNLPSIDMDRHCISYASPFHVMEHLQDMGEAAVHITRRPYTPRTTLTAAAAVYDKMYGSQGLVACTYEIFHAIAWSPSPDQPKPLPPGSQTLSFKSLSSDEHKEFQQVLQQLAENPDDSILMRRAEDLFRKMRDESEADRLARGDTESIPVHHPSPTHKAPAPPGSDGLDDDLSNDPKQN